MVVKRRKVANLLALAVLAALRVRPMHPYELGVTLREWGKDDDMEIKWGSLYTVVGNLAKNGLIEAAESIRDGARPERTVYRITPAGHGELLDWVRELVGTPVRDRPLLVAGLSVLTVLPPDEAIALLAHRLAAVEAELTTARDRLRAAARDVPRIFLIETEYGLALREAEVGWLAGLLDELRSGRFPGLADWASWHATGRLPTGLADDGGPTPASPDSDGSTGRG